MVLHDCMFQVITWYAFLFNAEPELGDAHLIRDGITAVHRLDRRFDKTAKTVGLCWNRAI